MAGRAEVVLQENETVTDEHLIKQFESDPYKARQKKNIQHLYGQDENGKTQHNNLSKERGKSYIKAAELIIKHANMSPRNRDIALNNLQEIKDNWDNWEYVEYWNSQVNTHGKKSLKALTKVLAQELKVAFPKKKLSSILEKELSHAENHVNWKRDGKERETLREIIPVGQDAAGNEIYQVRTDIPISKFTKAQEAEWKSIILDPDPNKDWREQAKQWPKWFKKLSRWEQKFFLERLDDWKLENLKASMEEPSRQINIGEFLGTPPTTIRGYPGARNCYKSSIATYKKNKDTGEIELLNRVTKVRSGHVTPSKMKDKKERITATKENIKQLLLAEIQTKLDETPYLEAQYNYNIIVDLQTLITTSVLSKADLKDDADRLKAIKELRAEFADAKVFQQFLSDNGIQKPQDLKLTLNLVTSNHPVNIGRVFGNSILTSTGRKAIRENNLTLKTLKFEAKQLQPIFENNLKADPNYASDPRYKNYVMAQAALTKMNEISGYGQRISNLLTFATEGPGAINHNAERAALEQIAVSGLGGIRLGSCMSGKDREGVVSEHVAAMSAFYARHDHFPPIPGATGLSKDQRKERDEYETLLAKEFLLGYEQRIAADNAAGCEGLKSVKVTLGKNALEKAQKLLVEEHFTSAEERKYWEKVDLAKLTEKVASLNRIKKFSKDVALLKELSVGVVHPEPGTEYVKFQKSKSKKPFYDDPKPPHLNPESDYKQGSQPKRRHR